MFSNIGTGQLYLGSCAMYNCIYLFYVPHMHGTGMFCCSGAEPLWSSCSSGILKIRSHFTSSSGLRLLRYLLRKISFLICLKISCFPVKKKEPEGSEKSDTKGRLQSSVMLVLSKSIEIMWVFIQCKADKIQ